MTLNNRTFTLLKIVLLIIISIFIAEIIVLPKIEHDMLQEAGRQELVTVQQICGAVLENYPDVEQDFILGLRQPTNSLQEKGEQILKQYGYDEEHLLADNTLYAAYMIAWRNWTGFFLVVVNGENGVLSSDSITEWADNLISILKNPAVLIKMRSSARTTALLYDEKSIANQILESYAYLKKSYEAEHWLMMHLNRTSYPVLAKEY